MAHYIAIVEDAGPDAAVGIWFPDLPGCFSAGDTVDDALRNAPEAIAAYADSLASNGQALPVPRRLTAIRTDPSWSSDLADHLIALVEAPRSANAA